MIRGLLVGLIASAALSFACGGDKSFEENLIVENVSPTGSVGGLVLDGADDRPLAGVEVKVVAGSTVVVTTTDASGIFSVTDLPASGVVFVIFEKEGYLSAQQTGVFENAAGNFPVDNATVTLGPISLLPSTGSFSVYVFDEMGQPATGHILTLSTRTRYLEYVDGMPQNRGEITVSAQVAGSGLARFTGIPDYNLLGTKVDAWVDVTVPPYDHDGDGFYEFAGGRFSFDMLNLGNPQPTILLDSHYPGALQIEASSVQALEGWPLWQFAPDSVPPVGPIHVLFNLPVDEDSLLVTVWDEAGTTSLAAQVQVSGRSLTIRFPTALATGAEYNMLIVATAATGDRLLTAAFAAPFFVIDPGATVTATIRLENPLDAGNLYRLVTFSEPVGFGMPGVSLSGSSNCIIFYDYFQIGPGGSSNVTGDDPGELGNSSCYCDLINPSCDSAFYNNEPMPMQPAGAMLSGYTRHWRFRVPYVYDASMLVPANTPVHLIFNNVGNLGYVMRRVNGEPVPRIILTLPSS